MNAITDGQLQEIRRLAESKGANSERMQQILRLGFLADLFEPRAKLEYSSKEQSGAWGSFYSIREDVRKELRLASIDSMYGTIDVDYQAPLDQLIAECKLEGVDERITVANFPPEGKKRKQKLTWKLVTFANKWTKPEDAKIEIEERKLGFRHATLRELLAFRNRWKEHGKSYVGCFENSIFALGSSAVLMGTVDAGLFDYKEVSMDFYPQLEYMRTSVNYDPDKYRNRYCLRVDQADGAFGGRSCIAPGDQVLIVAEYRPSHFPRNRVKGYVRKGSIVKGRTVAVIGKSCEFGIGNKLTPVRFEDGKCGIVSIRESDDERTLGIWNPDTPAAKEAVESSVEIPTVRRGIGSDVIHVIGKDSKSEFLVKLFYNTKKLEHGRADELHR